MSARERFAELFANRMHGRTQKEVAEELGIDQSSLSRYVKGGRRPSVEVARRIGRRWPEMADVLTVLLLWEEG